jgi:hypothetical protein
MLGAADDQRTGHGGGPTPGAAAFWGDIVEHASGDSAKLLLMSANDKHPLRPCQWFDQVGRNYMFHNSQAVLAVSLEPNPTIFQKTIALNDFYFGMDGFEHHGTSR